MKPRQPLGYEQIPSVASLRLLAVPICAGISAGLLSESVSISAEYAHTCQLTGVSAFDYLTELQIHAAELSCNPQQWMPWNYRNTLQRQNSASLSDSL